MNTKTQIASLERLSPEEKALTLDALATFESGKGTVVSPGQPVRERSTWRELFEETLTIQNARIASLERRVIELERLCSAPQTELAPSVPVSKPVGKAVSTSKLQKRA